MAAGRRLLPARRGHVAPRSRPPGTRPNHRGDDASPAGRRLHRRREGRDGWAGARPCPGCDGAPNKSVPVPVWPVGAVAFDCGPHAPAQYPSRHPARRPPVRRRRDRRRGARAGAAGVLAPESSVWRRSWERRWRRGGTMGRPGRATARASGPTGSCSALRRRGAQPGAGEGPLHGARRFDRCPTMVRSR